MLWFLLTAHLNKYPRLRLIPKVRPCGFEKMVKKMPEGLWATESTVYRDFAGCAEGGEPLSELVKSSSATCWSGVLIFHVKHFSLFSPAPRFIEAAHEKRRNLVIPEVTARTVYGPSRQHPT